MQQQSAMTVRFWGVRGSIPSPGPTTIRYGGNTSCVSIEIDDDNVLVLDAGTGIRALGKALEGSTAAIFVLLTHAHWDHMQGFPFFYPIYQPERTVYLFPTPLKRALWCSVLEQMDGAHFPVTPEALPSRTACITKDVIAFLQQHGFHISALATNHPGGGSGYRIEHAGRSVVYLTDNELDPPYAKATEFEEFVDFCQGVDVLIHDAQYLDSDMPHKHGWGHSLVQQVCALATAAQVRHLVLYHHDPDRTDDEVDAIQEMARHWLYTSAPHMQCTAAYEGLTICV
jgi:phosphoribosyl 1,2-cyclic phosphodiesterase